MNQAIEMPCFRMVINLVGNGEDIWGDITSDLKNHDAPEGGDEWLNEQEYNFAIDGLEALVLAHACAGVDVLNPRYIEGIETAAYAIAQHVG